MLYVVLATYNEAPNVEACVYHLQKALRGVPHALVVVDDSSPDGTAELVRGMAADPGRTGEVHLLARPGKLGLGSAYRAAVEFISERLEPGRSGSGGAGAEAGGGASPASEPWVAILDADLQHDPYDIPRLWEHARGRGLDVCYGSRYAPGGGVVNWGRSRVFVSAAANSLTRSVLGLRCTDCTSSMRVYRLGALRDALGSSEASGFAIQVEVMARCERAGRRVGGVPIVFEEREEGRSKFCAKEAALFVGALARLALLV